jgi:hypothetical protein
MTELRFIAAYNIIINEKIEFEGKNIAIAANEIDVTRKDMVINTSSKDRLN